MVAFTLSWRLPERGGLYGIQTEDAPILHRFSASLANSHASSRRGRTTADGLAQSVSARPAPAGATRSPTAAAADPHAAAVVDAASDGRDCDQSGVASDACSGRGAEGLGPGRPV